jgi:hypothetical protein
MLRLAEYAESRNDASQDILLGVLNDLMNRKSLRWLTDFHDLTSAGSLHD